MELFNLLTNEINQNGYHFNKLTKNKIGILYIAPVNIVPEDCLACDGYVLKIVDYKKLHAIIGSKINTGGEASDEFRIPDYNITGRFLQPGINVGNLINAGLPNLTGAITTSGANLSGASGVFSCDTSAKNRDDVLDTNGNKILRFKASSSNAIYGASSTVQPPSQVVHICIKYR